MTDGKEKSARAEALALYRMLGHDGNTVEAIRELIGVPPKIEHVLPAFAQAHPCGSTQHREKSKV